MTAAIDQPAANASLQIQGTTAVCAGHWTVTHLHRLETELRQLRWPAGAICLDLSAVGHMDTGGAWMLQRLLAALEGETRPVELRGLSAKAAGLLELVRATTLESGAVPRAQRPAMLAGLGRNSLDIALRGIGLVAFIGEVGAAWMRQLAHPGRIRWREIGQSLGEAGHRALGIVGLLSFLLGIVIAYQGGIQLRQYGGSLFVADLVGLSLVRELAPLITAIIVAGRTGSAYTAQIGTMQVTEEVDALRSMGISICRYVRVRSSPLSVAAARARCCARWCCCSDRRRGRCRYSAGRYPSSAKRRSCKCGGASACCFRTVPCSADSMCWRTSARRCVNKPTSAMA